MTMPSEVNGLKADASTMRRNAEQLLISSNDSFAWEDKLTKGVLALACAVLAVSYDEAAAKAGDEE